MHAICKAILNFFLQHRNQGVTTRHMSDVANITTTITPYPFFTADKDMLLIIASVSMAVATLVLILLVRRILHSYNALILLGEISGQVYTR